MNLFRVVLFLTLLLACWPGTDQARAEEPFFSILIGTQPNRTAADRVTQGYKNKGLEAFFRSENVPGEGAVFRIYVGMTGTQTEAENLARRLKNEGAIDDYQILEMKDARATPGRRVAPSGPRVDTPFKKAIYGRYIGSFRDKEVAEKEADGLTRAGWPATVQNEAMDGGMWYRVYLLAPGGGAYGGNTAGAMPGFEMVADMSEWAPDQIGRTGEPFSRCGGRAFRATKVALLHKINGAMPGTDYWAAMRELSLRQTDDTESRFSERAQNFGRLNPADNTRRLWGVQPYDRGEFDRAIDRLVRGRTGAPLGWALEAADPDLSGMPARKALLIVSDFDRTWTLEDPRPRARALKEKYGAALCIYTVYVDPRPDGVALAQDLALIGGCGGVYDGCRLLDDPEYFAAFMSDFMKGRTGGGPGTGIGEACRGVPPGALVDDRGCWVAALGTFFDFDQATIKPEFLPGIKWAADILQQNPGIRVEVDGFTDSMGSPGYNLGLGLRRAEAVRGWLIKYGVNPSRLKIKSYGESRPAADNATEVGRARNRRVELTVIK